MGRGGCATRKGPSQILATLTQVCMAGWALGCCPWALQHRHKLCVFPHWLIAQILSGIMLPVWAPGLAAASICVNTTGVAHTGNQYVEEKEWKVNETVRPPLFSPKIEVQREKSSLQHFQAPGAKTAADPSETPAVGWRDADQWGLRRSMCVYVCMWEFLWLFVPVRPTQLYCSLLPLWEMSSGPRSLSLFLSVSVSLSLPHLFPPFSPLLFPLLSPLLSVHVCSCVAAFASMWANGATTAASAKDEPIPLSVTPHVLRVCICGFEHLYVHVFMWCVCSCSKVSSSANTPPNQSKSMRKIHHCSGHVKRQTQLKQKCYDSSSQSRSKQCANYAFLEPLWL